jgi:dihydroneopterin aldolase
MAGGRQLAARRSRRVQTEESTMDIVFIHGLRIETTIGIYDWEKETKQPVVLDLEMASDIARGAATDRIEDALDYKAVSKRLKQFVSESRFELVETLAEQVAGIIRDEFGVPWVRLTLNKVGAVTDSEGVGVIIERGSQT